MIKKKSNKRSITTIIVILICFILLGIVANFFIFNTHKSIQNEDLPTQYSSWKKFENPELNFTFSYPSDWKVILNNTDPYEPKRLEITRNGLTYIFVYLEESNQSNIKAIKTETIPVGNMPIQFDYFYTSVTDALAATTNNNALKNDLPFHNITFVLDARQENQQVDLQTIKGILSTFEFTD